MLEEVKDGRLLLRSNHVGRDFFDKLERMRAGGHFVDVRIRAAALPVSSSSPPSSSSSSWSSSSSSSPPFPAHKMVLSLCSSYFEKMFTAGFAERDEGEVTVGGVGSAALGKVLDFFYTGLLKVGGAEEAFELLEAADLLLLTQTKKALAKYLMQILSAENCISCQRVASRFCLSELEESAKRFMRRHFESVSASSELSDLDLDDLVDLLGADNLFARSEDALASAVANWLSGREQLPGEDDLRRLADRVDWPAVSSECKERLLTGHPELKHLMEDSAQDDERIRRRRKKRSSCHKLILAVGFDSREVECLDPDCPEDGWSVVTEVPALRYGLSGAGLCSWGPLLLVTGGVGSRGILSAVPRLSVYNSATNEWTDGPDMNAARKSHFSCVYGDHLWVAGGTDDQAAVLTAERIPLDRVLDKEAKWVTVSDLGDWLNGREMLPWVHSGRNSLVCVCHYGANNDKVYDVGSDAWSPLPVSDGGGRMERDRPGVAVLGESTLVVAGGSEGKKALDVVETLDLSAEESLSWRRRDGIIPPLNVAREAPGLAAVDGRLFAVGGKGSGGTVEVLEEDKSEWRLLKEGCRLKHPRDEYSVAVVDRI